MNYSTAIFLVRSDIRAVAVSYDVDSEGKGIRPFVIFKTPDPTVSVGDFVIIPTDTRHKMTVARVEEVDLEIDFASTTQIGWLVGGVDRSAFEAVTAMEGQAITAIKSAEKRRAQEELRDKLIADNPGLRAFETIDVTPALPAPPVT